MIDITQHIGLVGKMISLYCKRLLNVYEYDDLFQTGCLGLMRAAQKFDESKGKFSTYACQWILGEIRRMDRDDKYIPNPYRDKQIYSMDSLDREITGTEGSLTVSDILSDGIDYAEIVDDSLMLKTALNKISKKERKIIEDYFIKEKKQKVIAKEINQTQVNVSRLISKSLKTMRKAM